MFDGGRFLSQECLCLLLSRSFTVHKESKQTLMLRFFGGIVYIEVKYVAGFRTIFSQRFYDSRDLIRIVRIVLPKLANPDFGDITIFFFLDVHSFISCIIH